MTFFTKMNPSTIFWNAGEISIDFEYFLNCSELEKRTYAQLIICSKYTLTIA